MKKLLLSAALLLGALSVSQAAPAKLFASNLGNGITPSGGLVGLSSAVVRFGVFPDAYEFDGKTYAQLNTDFIQVGESTTPLSVDGARGFFDVSLDYDTSASYEGNAYSTLAGKKVYIWILTGAVAETAPQQAIFSTSQTWAAESTLFPNHTMVSPDTSAMELVAHVGVLEDGENIGGTAAAHKTAGEAYLLSDVSVSRTPSDESVFTGTQVVFEAVADSGSEFTLTYQWRKNGKNISRATSSTLTLLSAKTTDTGSYDVVVKDGPTVIRTSNAVALNVLSVKPTFVQEPTGDVIPLGADLTLESEAVSPNGVVYQWKKGASLVGANDSQLFIRNATAFDAGAYTVMATNAVKITGGGSTTTKAVQVVVIEQENRTYAGAEAGSIKLTAVYYGKPTGFLWKKDGEPLANGGQFAGVTTKTLTVKTLSVANDGDVYTCEIFSGEDSLESGEFSLVISNAAPSYTDASDPIVMPAALLGSQYSYQIPASTVAGSRPTSYKASGLPSGLVVNAATGLITGSPKASKGAVPYAVTFTISNGPGVRTVTRKATLIVSGLPANLEGTYVAWIARQVELLPSGYSLTNNLGGRIDMTVSKLGAITGKITLGNNKVISFTGSFPDLTVANPTTTIVIRRPAISYVPLDFKFTVNTTTNLLTSATIQDSYLVPGQTKITSATVTGWRRTFSSAAPATNYVGIYNAAVTASGTSASNPKGASILSMTAKTDGSISMTGMTADGEKLTGSTFVGPTGQVVVFNLIYTPLKGSLLGNLQLNNGTVGVGENIANNDTIGGTLSWLRPAGTTTKSRAYQSGFSLNSAALTIAGSRYARTLATNFILDLADERVAKLDFEGEDAGVEVGGSPDIDVLLKASNKVEVQLPNPRTTKLVVNAAKGTFSGTFIHDGVANRSVKFSGHVIRNGTQWEGFGYFLLTQAPGTTTDPIQSGQVTLAIPLD
ncbi:putative Ig domain-containing protein [Prosthecobacter fusiformis]|uniref:Putative Ig domain-containing protein n=1 Tax=Prosthecobacter fusiformis TaxID=48464 RepID=A0A4R7SRN9_9BACT|nr:putative Ig domain-containing protein [Prosthecobacter fusiformis]TDU80827.1 putative Ig domain-containing protein [Prosthecobacter fusiformis]